ncbi:hypothetical protein [Arthrobacter sp. NEB 688]|uniref:TY-Chap2 family putative peptide chaperone n=1 Tax=Arthrobacter sp. NEB 688 TaxID=904039 RepID=UPI001566D92D|nr:hypothetical protein [Arthrobacter sp. NEB 688]QKE84376.1 hypothetical protein HL663_10810 [Arthrobacter sp. NEB 688]
MNDLNTGHAGELHGADNPIGCRLLDAASWALAARLARRHPHRLRIFHGRPGGGQSDVLWLRDPALRSDGGDVRLNRVGRINVMRRFDALGDAREPRSIHYTWQQALAPRCQEASFALELERAAGLPALPRTPAATGPTLTWRVIACLLSAAATTDVGVTVEPGFYDDDWSGPSPHFARFPAVDSSATDVRAEDPLGQSGYRFWFVLHQQRPVIAFEQTAAVAWIAGGRAEVIDMMKAYRQQGGAAGVLAVTGAVAQRAGLRLH